MRLEGIVVASIKHWTVIRYFSELLYVYSQRWVMRTSRVAPISTDVVYKPSLTISNNRIVHRNDRLFIDVH